MHLRVDVPMTRRKLAEAKFFLAHLEEQTRKMQQNWEAFGFYLSAFLSAGRSVTLVLQSEDKEGWEVAVCHTPCAAMS